MRRSSSRVPWFVSAAILVATARPALSQVVIPPGTGALGGGATVPTAAYDAALAALAAGEFSAGLDIASRDYRGAIRIGTRRWIDSIAPATAAGEAHYELGNLRDALAAYEEALAIWAANGDWLLAVQFPPQPLHGIGRNRAATWGQSRRNTSPAALPGQLLIRQGGADTQQVLQQGGVLTAPVNYPIRPQEISRALVISIYRQAEILGDLARESVALDEVTKALGRRPAPADHWSQAWIDVALGVASWSLGKTDQATTLLQRGVTLANQFDHPLTAWGLIVLGRIALDGGQAAAALRLFEEATYAAADHGDARALEEAFRLVFAVHMAEGHGPPTAFATAAEWARRDLPSLRARLVAMQAEGFAAAGDLRSARDALGSLDSRLLQGDSGRGMCGIQAAYATALVAYRSGDMAAGDLAIEKAVTLARGRTPRLFQTARLVELVASGPTTISDRQADVLFGKLLVDPPPREFSLDPVGMLATVSSPRLDAFESWLGAAWRRGHDAYLTAGEMRLRSRWLTAQPLGGRKSSLESLLAARPESLPRPQALRRAAILAREPELARSLEDAARMRPPLTMSLVSPDAAAAKAQWDAYGANGRRLSAFVTTLAAGRDPTTFEFPPFAPPADLRRRLPERHLMLSFQWTAAGLTGSLESNARVATWQVKQPETLAREIAALLTACGIVGAGAPVTTERLVEAEWPAAAEVVERLLFENSKIDLRTGIEELVIVPDGMLWYVPFELLPVGSAREGGEERRLLRDVCRIRYAPTRGLALLPDVPAAADGPLGIHAARLFRGARPDAGAEVVARFAAAFDRVVSLGTTAVPLLEASLCDRLLLADEVGGDGPVSGRPLVVVTTGKQSFTFGDWLNPPPKRPQIVIVPGFQSSIADGLLKTPADPGEDLFMAATDLLAAGARTVVLSRWRMGGKTSMELAHQFLLGLESARPNEADDAPGRSEAARAWQRAVDVVMAEEPDVSREPRVRQASAAVLDDTRHPLFWAGYVLLDCGGGREAEHDKAGDEAAPIAPAKAAP